MKRMIASRKLKRCCESCGKGFVKGEIYYHERRVWTFFDGHEDVVMGYNYTKCPRCFYKEKEHSKRYNVFQANCQHPKKEFIEEVWDYIPGEAVMEPQYDVCRLCGNKFW